MMNVSSCVDPQPDPSVMLFVLLTFGGCCRSTLMKVQNFPDIDLPTVTSRRRCPAPHLRRWKPTSRAARELHRHRAGA
jgi:hypothetical protein